MGGWVERERDKRETRVELFDDCDHTGEINGALLRVARRPTVDSDVHGSAVPAVA